MAQLQAVLRHKEADAFQRGFTPRDLRKCRQQHCVHVGEVTLYENVLNRQEKKCPFSLLTGNRI